MKKNNIMPSLLSADFKNLEKILTKFVNNGTSEIHYDVMDSKFVPALSFGSGVLKSISDIKGVKYDVHLMVSNPQDVWKEYITESTSGITWHHESFSKYSQEYTLLEDMASIAPDIKRGISIKPATNVEQIYEFLPLIDIILVMSVEPGKGGQKFIAKSLDKIEKISEYIKKRNLKCEIYVDGGINFDTGQACFEAGADKLVAGSFVFGSKDMIKTINELEEKKNV